MHYSCGFCFGKVCISLCLSNEAELRLQPPLCILSFVSQEYGGGAAPEGQNQV